MRSYNIHIDITGHFKKERLLKVIEYAETKRFRIDDLVGTRFKIRTFSNDKQVVLELIEFLESFGDSKTIFITSYLGRTRQQDLPLLI